MSEYTIQGKYGYTIEIITDEDAESPRSWDNLGTMACWHRNYNLGDIQPKESPIEHMAYLVQNKTIINLDNAKDETIQKLFDRYYISLPLYLFDHSGITMNTSGFSCPWDSGQVGIIYVDKARIRKEYGWKRFTITKIKKIHEYLKSEVTVYDQYLIGDVYGFVVKDKDGKETDSCWGFFGGDIKTNGMMDHLSEYIEEA